MFEKKSIVSAQYHSDGHEKLEPISSEIPSSKKKLLVCSSIFPNDEIKFVSKRKSKTSHLRYKITNNEKIVDPKKVENRSCDPCRIF